MPEGTSLRKNEAQTRYEILIGDTVAGRLEYNVLANALLLTHTEVEREYEGRGFASALVKYALDDVRSQALHVVPVCKVVAAYMHRHPEYQDLATPEVRKAFNV